MTYDIVFVVASIVAIGAALMVVLSGNPFISSLSLIANLIALATFYILLQSDFLAAAQVIVYAGAVMIMFLFVTAYLGGRADEPTRRAAGVADAGRARRRGRDRGRDHLRSRAPELPARARRERRVRLAAGDRRRFLGRYLLAFEGTSVLLLIAAVGGVMLATRRAAPRGAGRAGRVRGRAARARAQLQSVGDGGRDGVRGRALRRRAATRRTDG